MNRKKAYRMAECKGGQCASGFPVVCANFDMAPVSAVSVCRRCWHLEECHAVSK